MLYRTNGGWEFSKLRFSEVMLESERFVESILQDSAQVWVAIYFAAGAVRDHQDEALDHLNNP